jgi:hypothetical protein
MATCSAGVATGGALTTGDLIGGGGFCGSAIVGFDAAAIAIGVGDGVTDCCAIAGAGVGVVF